MKRFNLNLFYNIVYQLLSFVIPLITTPYLSRVLGVNNIGIYSYTYSIVYYFMLFSLLGINNYGSREISKSSSDKFKLSKTFFSIYYLQCFCSIIMISIYLVLCFLFFKEYKNIFFIQFLFLLSSMFDINWFFFGLEKFKVTISRNVFIKLLSLFLIFILVNDSSDLIVYTVIMSLSTLLSQLYLWLFLKKEVMFVKVGLTEVFSHLKDILILFIPIISYSVYRVMDKTMLGFVSGTFQLGLYESAEKIINIPLSIVAALGTVILPFISKDNDSGISNKIYDVFKITFFIVLPMILGICVIADDFSSIFFGAGFDGVSNIIILLLPSVLFSSVATVVRMSYLIPQNKNCIYVNSTLIGAVINFLFNLFFIRKFGAIGACFGTIFAEFFVMLYQVIFSKKVINFIIVFSDFISLFWKSLFMMIVIYIAGLFISNIIIKLFVQVILGVICYICFNHKFIISNFFVKR